MLSRDEAVILFRKADEDVRLAALLADKPEFSDEAFGFHLQQSMEKLLKALLAARGMPFPFSHNLYELVDLCREKNVEIPDYADDLCILTPFATGLRYSAISIDDAEPLDRVGLLNRVTELRRFVHEQLRL